MNNQHIIDALKAVDAEVSACGSRVTCNPTPADTDWDFLVFCKSSEISTAVHRSLTELDFTCEGAEHYQSLTKSEFVSYRDIENRNMIVTKCDIFSTKHKGATSLCKSLNLMDKKDRVSVFQAILYECYNNNETNKSGVSY